MTGRAKQQRELHNAIAHVCEFHDATVSFSTTSRGHQLALIELRARKAAVRFAASGDWRAFHNAVSAVRRALKEMEQS